jgi:iron complex outermembrane receptor protein
MNVYASFAMSSKEPNRNDFVQSDALNRPSAENLRDIEAGWRFKGRKLSAGVNLYDMQYRNQLVLNGQINNVGAYNRVNVKSSFRRGVEIEAAAPMGRYLRLSGNVALSQNKIRNYSEFTDSTDANYTVYVQHRTDYNLTDISFSPSYVSSLMLSFLPFKGMEISLIHKGVGRQYLDNTSDSKRSINPYSLLDARINYSFSTKLVKEITLMLGVYNILSETYETNGYTYSYYTDTTLTTMNFYAPAAPINVLGGIRLHF